MTKQEFLESSSWYEDEPVRIKQLAFEDGYRIGKQEVIDKACADYCKVCGVGLFTALPYDCKKDCMMFQNFCKTINED